MLSVMWRIWAWVGAYSTPAGQRRKTNDLPESNDATRGHAAWLCRPIGRCLVVHMATWFDQWEHQMNATITQHLVARVSTTPIKNYSWYYIWFLLCRLFPHHPQLLTADYPFWYRFKTINYEGVKDILAARLLFVRFQTRISLNRCNTVYSHRQRLLNSRGFVTAANKYCQP